MITASIAINGVTIMARSAHRLAGSNNEVCTYKVDDGQLIKHHPKEGAVVLSIKLLKTIKEVK